MLPVLVAGPAVEPVSLADMRLYLRLDGTDEDELVAALIAAARLQIEAATRCALLCDGTRNARLALFFQETRRWVSQQPRRVIKAKHFAEA